ncbi:MAG: hypothetical protein ACKVS6_05225 [Planctomycetota bacterium]
MLRIITSLTCFLGLAAVPIVNLSVTSDTALSDDAPARPKPQNYTVHEWGTFTTLAGSDGVQLVGLTHDEEALPKFVYHYEKHEKGFEGVNVKMETPVIYFYSKEERYVSVTVDFPKGVLTQWFPQVRHLQPAAGITNPELKNGKLRWGVNILPAGTGEKDAPPVDANDSWRFARETDANYIRMCSTSWEDAAKNSHDESERFLFYRGLGKFDLPIVAKFLDNGELNIKNSGNDELRDLVLLRVENGKIYFKDGGNLRANSAMQTKIDFAETTVDKAMAFVAKKLEGSGLYAKESLAMVNTWRKSYFETPGVRVLYVVPRKLTDQILPLTIDPMPSDLVRVLVGRYDVLTPEAEKNAEATIKKTNKPSEAMSALGRFAEPITRRVRETTKDAEVRSNADCLLQQFTSNGCSKAPAEHCK